jgi:predicted heme/steroid binding protein
MKPNIDRVIEIFSAISQQLGPQYLAYWALPNTVLTLSGARAYSDGVFWGNDNKDLPEEWNEEIAESMEIVKK